MKNTSESFFGICLCADEYLLQLSKFRDSVVDISKLSPIFGGIIEELKKYAVVLHQDFLYSILRHTSVFSVRSLCNIACISNISSSSLASYSNLVSR